MRATAMVVLAGVVCFGSAGGEIYQYQPREYSLLFSPYEKPVLHVKNGDTVVTKTADAWGFDEKGKPSGRRSNPLTGPFYIEGAEPGDSIAVVLERLRLNRKTGFQLSSMAAGAVPPEYHMRKNRFGTVNWVFNLDAMTASPASLSGMENFHLQLRPMLGCIGTAPRLQEAQASITADSFGGNMDYNRIVEGATVYLPVNVTGAYLFLGDGHAAQGDGEVNGSGIETSMDVRFRVTILKKKTIPSARVESSEFYMAMGSARPLDDALQQATVNMIEWLTSEFSLDIQHAQVFLGAAAEYDIANVADPRYTVACRVRKVLLRQLIEEIKGSHK